MPSGAMFPGKLSTMRAAGGKQLGVSRSKGSEILLVASAKYP